MTHPNPKDPQAELSKINAAIPGLMLSQQEKVLALFQAREQQSRISTLKRFSHVPPPHDEEWSEEFQKGVEHGVLLSQQKLRFEIQRLKKQSKIGELNVRK